MAKLTIKGNVTEVGELQTFSDTAAKRTLIINEQETTEGGQTFDNDVAVDFWKKNLDKIERVKVGDYVEIGASVRSNSWTNKDDETKWFTNIAGYFCKVVGTSPKTQEDESENNTNDFPF